MAENEVAIYIYHMAEEVRWKEAGEEGYFPATFAEEGFSHATEQPHLVLPVANRLLTGVPGNFVCLLIDTAVLKSEVKFEPAGELIAAATHLAEKPSASTGDETPGHTAEQTSSPPQQPLFPHIFGPIDSASVVVELAVQRSNDGKFISIEGFGNPNVGGEFAAAAAAAAEPTGGADGTWDFDASWKRLQDAKLEGPDALAAAARAECEAAAADAAAALDKRLEADRLKGPEGLLDGLEREMAAMQAKMDQMEK